MAAVAPGFVATDMAAEHLKPPRGDEIRAQSPFGRVPRPEEVAAAVVYLASPEAEWASGTVLDLNGAATCGDPRRHRPARPRPTRPRLMKQATARTVFQAVHLGA